jgi:hypothetical protein
MKNRPDGFLFLETILPARLLFWWSVTSGHAFNARRDRVPPAAAQMPRFSEHRKG